MAWNPRASTTITAVATDGRVHDLERAPDCAGAAALIPWGANRTIMVRAAWRSEESMLERPDVNGSDGWTPVGKPATGEVILNLKDQGFTWVNGS